MKRCDIVTVAVSGDFGKPRPALIVQSEVFDTTSTVTVLPMTSHLIDAPLVRFPIEPSGTNGLRAPTQVMIDKAMSVKRGRIGNVVGRLDDDAMASVNRLLALFLGFA